MTAQPEAPIRMVAGGGRGNSGGFTLIELLVSIAILATGVVVVLHAFETSLVALGQSQDALRASVLIADKSGAIRSQVAEIGLVREARNGVFDAPHDRYRWRIESRDIETMIGNAGTNKLTEVVVFVRRDGSSTEYSAATYVRTKP